MTTDNSARDKAVETLNKQRDAIFGFFKGVQEKANNTNTSTIVPFESARAKEYEARFAGLRNDVQVHDSILRGLQNRFDASTINPGQAAFMMQDVRGQALTRTGDYGVEGGFLSNVHNVLNELNTLDNAIQVDIAAAAGRTRQALIDVATQIRNAADIARTHYQDTITLQGELAPIAATAAARISAVGDMVTGGAEYQPALFEAMSPEEKELMRITAPPLFEAVSKLPPSSKAPKVAQGGTAGAKAGSGAGVGGDTRSGSPPASTAAKPEVKATPIIGTFMGRNLYDGSSKSNTQVPSQLVGRTEGGFLRATPSGIEIVPADGDTPGYSFTLEALRDGAVDLRDFGGDVAKELGELKGTLLKAQRDEQFERKKFMESIFGKGTQLSENGDLMSGTGRRDYAGKIDQAREASRQVLAAYLARTAPFSGVDANDILAKYDASGVYYDNDGIQYSAPGFYSAPGMAFDAQRFVNSVKDAEGRGGGNGGRGVVDSGPVTIDDVFRAGYNPYVTLPGGGEITIDPRTGASVGASIDNGQVIRDLGDNAAQSRVAADRARNRAAREAEGLL